jgi:hypothetical protein
MIVAVAAITVVISAAKVTIQTVSRVPCQI